MKRRSIAKKRSLPPPPWDLKAADRWLTWKFGVKGEYRGALRFVKRCLREIGSADYRFLMAKASLLHCLDEWGQLAPLLVYLNGRFPNDAEVFANVAEVYAAQGAWRDGLRALRKAEKYLGATNTHWDRQNMRWLKIQCLLGLGNKRAAIRTAQGTLEKFPRFSSIRAALKNLLSGECKPPNPYAPRNAKIMGALRRIV